MNEQTRPPGPEAPVEPKRGLFHTLRCWLTPGSVEAESVRDVIEELIEERNEEGPPDGGPVIDPNERLLLGNVLKMRTVAASDIMVPRPDIVAVELETPLPEVLTLLMKERHSRLPVYRETLDDVVGLVHIKDLAVMAAYRGATEAGAMPSLRDIVRNMLFVSPAVRVLDLLMEMRLKRAHMALVVDEYGGIDGLVTIEDVVEQIVGEIEDEHDGDQAPTLVDNSDSTAAADARVTLEEFESRFGRVFSDEEREATDTLGGLVIRLAGHVPGRGELVKHSSGMEFEVIEGDPRRIRQLRLRGLPAPAPAGK
ncbi:MAG: HlyC/CorC family transporter [Rhodospirillaceae bacterium]|nr:HlyC/CorC family transporter [Rhodospirillaceae bacterium]